MRLYAYIGLALALVGGWFYLNRLQHKAARVDAAEAALHAEERQHKADVAALQAARDHERKIANDASNQFQTTVTSLQDELSKRPLKPVVIRVPNGPLSGSSCPASAATGSDAQAQGRIDGETEKDIGPELTEYALDCQINAAELEALQGWVRSR